MDDFLPWRVAFDREKPSLQHERAMVRAVLTRDGWRAGFVPTGADWLDDTIYLLERRFSLLDGGFASRLVALDLEQIRQGGPLAGHVLAQLGRPAISENFEGIAARRGADGRTLLYLVSDDNFLVLQRTLLLQFSLAGP